MRRLIDARLRKGELLRVEIEGAEKPEFWMRPEMLDALSAPLEDRVHILSPFDPLVIQRKRLKFFFDYEHMFEAYVPKAKRRFGYCALPVLVGDEIVAAIDIKADRENKKVLAQKWTWPAPRSNRAYKKKVDEALHRIERFQLRGLIMRACARLVGARRMSGGENVRSNRSFNIAARYSDEMV